MKKLLLSSIIMFGICGFVTAQNATGSKFGKTTTTATKNTSAAAPTPQKSATDAPAIAPASADAVAPASTKTADAAAAPVAPAGKVARVSKTQSATAVNADGTVQEASKNEDAKPVAPVRKN